MTRIQQLYVDTFDPASTGPVVPWARAIGAWIVDPRNGCVYDLSALVGHYVIVVVNGVDVAGIGPFRTRADAKEVEQHSYAKRVCGRTFRRMDGSYCCIGYDARWGYWMLHTTDAKDLRNVSERAIGRTFHEVRAEEP